MLRLWGRVSQYRNNTHFPSAFFFHYRKKRPPWQPLSWNTGEEDAHTILLQGLASLTVTHSHTFMPEHSLTRTNAPGWLLPPLRGWSWSRSSALLCRGLVRERRNISMRKSKESGKREMTDTVMPGATEPQCIPNRLAADLQIQHSHLACARSNVRCAETNWGRQRKGDGEGLNE